MTTRTGRRGFFATLVALAALLRSKLPLPAVGILSVQAGTGISVSATSPLIEVRRDDGRPINIFDPKVVGWRADGRGGWDEIRVP